MASIVDQMIPSVTIYGPVAQLRREVFNARARNPELICINLSIYLKGIAEIQSMLRSKLDAELSKGGELKIRDTIVVPFLPLSEPAAYTMGVAFLDGKVVATV